MMLGHGAQVLCQSKEKELYKMTRSTDKSFDDHFNKLDAKPFSFRDVNIDDDYDDENWTF